jgi:hypothetical protein
MRIGISLYPKPNMEAYQLRVVEEKTQLDVKIANLQLFLSEVMFSKLSPKEQHLLKRQLEVMIEYGKILFGRIELFSEARR